MEIAARALHETRISSMSLSAVVGSPSALWPEDRPLPDMVLAFQESWVQSFQKEGKCRCAAGFGPCGCSWASTPVPCSRSLISLSGLP